MPAAESVHAAETPAAASGAQPSNGDANAYINASFQFLDEHSDRRPPSTNRPEPPHYRTPDAAAGTPAAAKPHPKLGRLESAAAWSDKAAQKAVAQRQLSSAAASVTYQSNRRCLKISAAVLMVLMIAGAVTFAVIYVLREFSDFIINTSRDALTRGRGCCMLPSSE